MGATKKEVLICTMIFGALLLNIAISATTITLPKPILQKNLYLDQALQQRRSVRRFKKTPLTLAQLSQLLWAAQGITNRKHGFRTAPSAGALYPLELFIVKKDGVWHYNIRQHSLRLLLNKDIRRTLQNAAYNQKQISEAPVDLVITAIFKRETKKYGNRGIMFSYIEAGHAAQNFLLEATALGLGTVPIGGFNNEPIRKALGLQKNVEPIYIIPVGHRS